MAGPPSFPSDDQFQLRGRVGGRHDPEGRRLVSEPPDLIRTVVSLTGGVMARYRGVLHFVHSLAIILVLLLCAQEPSAAQSGQAGVSLPTLSQNPLLGSVPTGQATSTPLSLSLKDALSRALNYNLGVIEANEDTRAAHAARLRNLDTLLPNLS